MGRLSGAIYLDCGRTGCVILLAGLEFGEDLDEFANATACQRSAGVHQRLVGDLGLGDFAVWGSTLHDTHAAIARLLPLAAVAFGLTA
jgi:hypothetical protein